MADAYVRTIGTVTDMDGMPVTVGVDYDTVTVRAPAPARFTSGQAEEFAQVFVSACWSAGAQRAHMATEAST